MNNKIGFHLGIGGNANGIADYIARVSPAVVKSVDDYGICKQALDAHPDNVAVFRLSAIRDGYWFDVPNYELSPQDAAHLHWVKTKGYLPPEFDKRVWLEVINEVDKNRSEWLAEFSLFIAKMMVSEGYKPVLFGWSSGEPEPDHWRGEKMSNLLRWLSVNRDKAAISLHEYDFTMNGYPINPSHIGRFSNLHDACTMLMISKPTVFITELGWKHDNVPSIERIVSDLKYYRDLIGKHGNIKGAFLWYLGGGFGGIANKLQPKIKEITDLLASDVKVPDSGLPREQYTRTYWLIHSSTPLADAIEIMKLGFTKRVTVGFSYDDAGIGKLDKKYAVLWNHPQSERQVLVDWYSEHYPNTVVEFRNS